MSAVAYVGKVLETGTTTTSATSLTYTATGSVAVGDCVFVVTRCQAGVSVTAVSDSVGNTYTQVAISPGTGNLANIYCSIVKTQVTTSTTFTLTLSATNVSSATTAVVFTNVDSSTPFGSTVTANFSSQITVSLAGSVPNRHGSMLLAVGTISEAGSPNITTGSLTSIAPKDSLQWMRIAYRQNDDLSSYTVGWTSNSGIARSWGCVLVEVNRVPSDFLSLF